MKIGIFTPRSIAPLHPRLAAFKEYFSARGIQADIINESGYTNKVSSRINWLALWFFDLYAVKRCTPKLRDYEIILVTDLKYLPLVKHAKRLGKTVFYDTIDHNVFLRLYQLERKLPIVKLFRKHIVKRFTELERKYAFQNCDEIFVNSESLRQYFDNRALTLFYSSPFENMNISNDPENPPALLYLGSFTSEKGAHEILGIQKKLNLPLFVFGDVYEPKLINELKTNSLAYHSLRISAQELYPKLKELLQKHYLFGFSLIKPAHYSYEVQEANKDIDYLAMGIPLIGNYRLPTKLKIEAGCGVFFDDRNFRGRIMIPDSRVRLTECCRKFYAEHFASRHFSATLDGILGNYV